MKYVISLGGSLIVPDKINTSYVEKFVNLIVSQVKKGDRFYIVVGGGELARDYQRALKKIKKVSDDDLDWIGISATKMNAEFIKLAFSKIAGKQLITDPTKKITDKNPVQIIPGWKPGRSSDYEAVLVAKNHGIQTVINLSNIDYVYDKDPKKFKSTKKIKEMTWAGFFKLFGRKWKPGANVPFDQTAAQLAKKERIKVVVTNGKKIKNLENYLASGDVIGTIIN